MIKFFENEYATYSIHDGLMHFTYKKNTTINFEAARTILKDRLFIQQNQSYPVLCDARQILFMTKPARNYLAVEGSVLIDVVALVTKFRGPSNIAGNIYLNRNKPTVHTEIFTNISEAVNFLKAFQAKK